MEISITGTSHKIKDAKTAQMYLNHFKKIHNLQLLT